MFQTFFIIFTFLSGVKAVADDNFCRNTGQISPPFENTKMWIDLSKELTIEAAQIDLKGFCEWNRMDRATSAYLTPDEMEDRTESLRQYRAAKNTGDRDKAADLFDQKATLSPWIRSMMGNRKLKTPTTQYFSTWFAGSCQNKFIGCAKNLSSDLDSPGFSLNYDLRDYGVPKRPNASTTQIVGACLYLNPVRTIGCKNATNELLDLFETYESDYGNIQVTGVPLIKGCLTNKKITSALQRTAVKLWNGINNEKFNPGQNVFSDLVTELKKDGFPDLSAKKQAIEILGTIATGGPNFAARINEAEVLNFPTSCKAPKSCNLNGIMMAAIAEGMVHADTIKMQSRAPSLYSLPAGSNFPCDIGKSYHFWMSAAVTNHLVNKGYSRAASQTAVFASHIGYHLTGRGTDKDGGGALAMARFGSIENGIRMDMNLAAAGSSFGARIDQLNGTEDLKMTDGLVAIMRAGKLTPVSAEESFRGSPLQISDWLKRTGAAAAYDFYP